jgi:hypothetical protein
MDVHLDGPIQEEDLSLVKSRIKHATEVAVRKIIEEEVRRWDENPAAWRAEREALRRGFN